MANIPKKPQKGDRVLQSLYNTVCDIVDYLPTLNVVGDNKTTYVNHSAGGTTIHAVQPHSTIQGKANEYIAGSGIAITSGNIINAKLSAGPNINIDYNSGWLVISGTPAGSGGSSGGGSGYTYVGDGDLGSGHIFVDYSYTDPVICSNLRYIDNLLNYPISGDIIGNELHFVQIKDIKNGAGTSIDYHWNSTGNHDAEDGHLIKWIDGICVNLNVSGGTYITTKFHQGVGYGDYSSASIDCNLSGTYDWYPHTSGFIAIVPQYDLNQNITGGIISTNLHAGSGIAIDQYTGQISVTGSITPSPTPIENECIGYPNYGLLYNSDNGSVSGIGISFILPVSAGQEYKYYTDARDQIQNSPGSYKEYAFATYAPSEGETGDSRREINNGEEFVPSANGWVRISVFDDGKHEGRCLRFYKGADTDYQYSTPLYRFHGFTNYQAGAGIAINSGIISCMLQTDHNQLANGSGIVSTGLYGGNPYNPTLTGIAIGLSSSWAEDLTNIRKHAQVANRNKVLSSNASNQLEWTTLTLPEPVSNDLKAPDYTKLKLTEDTTNYSGMGTTYLVPISKGKRLKVEGTTVVARWAPVEGSTNVNAITLGSSYSTTTTTDGYVRVTVMDDGSRNGECVRLYVSGASYAGELPLHRYSTALSGAAGIMVENGGIRNMIQPGAGLTSTALKDANQVMTGIAFELSSQFVSDLTSISGRLSATTNEDRILSSHNGTLSWEENTASYTPPSTVFNMLAQGSGIQLTKLSDGKTKIDCTVQGGGGGGEGYIRWPNYANLHNNGNSISIQQDYTCDGNGGWLRISYKGQPQQQGSDYCYSLMIDGNAVGMYTLNSSLGMMGNTWILPIPPFSRFMVNFPTSNTYAYFDGAVYDSGDIQTIYATIIADRDGASGACNNAEQRYATASGCAYSSQYDYVNYIEADNLNDIDWYWDEYYTARRAVTGYIDAEDPDYNESGSIHYAAEAAEYATLASTEATRMINEGEDILGRANSYATEAANWATSALNWSTAASGAADDCYNWYLSAAAHFGITPRAKNYPNNDSH